MLPYNVPKSGSSNALNDLVKNLSSGNLSALAGGSSTEATKPQAPPVPANSLLPFAMPKSGSSNSLIKLAATDSKTNHVKK